MTLQSERFTNKGITDARARKHQADQLLHAKVKRQRVHAPEKDPSLADGDEAPKIEAVAKSDDAETVKAASEAHRTHKTHKMHKTQKIGPKTRKSRNVLQEKRMMSLIEQSAKQSVFGRASIRRMVYDEIVTPMKRRGEMKQETRIPISVVDNVLRHVLDDYGSVVMKRANVCLQMSNGETLQPEHITAQHTLLTNPDLQWNGPRI